MSECVAARIAIGGKLKAARWLDLLHEAIEEGVDLEDWNGVEVEESMSDPEEILDDDDHLVFYGLEVNYGEFRLLEQFCKDHQLAFDRYRDPRDEWDRDMYWQRFRKFKKHEYIYNGLIPVNTAGELLYPAKHFDELSEILTHKGTSDQACREAATYIRKLQSKPWALPKFELV